MRSRRQTSRTGRARLASWAGLAFFLLAGHAAGQDPALGQDPASSGDKVERYRAYLARQPYHESAFASLVEAALADGSLNELLDEYETVLEDAPADDLRIVSARLLAHLDRLDEALDRLSAVEDQPPEHNQLVGELYLDARRFQEAAVALDGAADGVQDARRLESIHRARARAWLEAGDRERGAEALAALCEIDPKSVTLRFLAAEELAREGFDDEALAIYAQAIELASDDPVRVSRARAARGRLFERGGRDDEALMSYEAALALLARGSWLRRDLDTRVLAVHARRGTLLAYCDELGEHARETPGDLGARELHAQALTELGRFEEAGRVLVEATHDFPRDLALARRAIGALERDGDTEALVMVLQGALEEHPDELDLILDLGRIFAADGRFEEARVRWQSALDTRLEDVSLCLQLAELNAVYGLHEEAIDLVERAIEREPGDVAHYAELAHQLVRAGRQDDLTGVLDRAETAAGDEPGALMILANLARGLRDYERARAALERALEVRPGDGLLLRSLADLLLEAQLSDDAMPVLAQLIRPSADDGDRRDAAGRLMRLRANGEGLAFYAIELERTITSNPEDAVALFLLARIADDSGRMKEARDRFARLAALDPGDLLAREELARVLERMGERVEAVEIHRYLAEHRPVARVRHLSDVARLQLADGEEAAAIATWEDILQLEGDRAGTLLRAARFHRTHGDLNEARQLLTRAMRAAPDDVEAPMELAEVLLLAGVREEAKDVARRVAANNKGAAGDRAREWLYERLLEEGHLSERMQELRSALDENPFDVEASEQLLDLYSRARDSDEAIKLIGELLAYRPRDLELLGQRAELRLAAGSHRKARVDFEAMWWIEGASREELRFQIAECALNMGDVEEAAELLAGTEDVVRTSRLYERAGMGDEATTVLEGALLRTPEDRNLLGRLVRIHERNGSLADAVEVHRRLVRLDGESWDSFLREAELAHAGGDEDAALGALARALDSLERPKLIAGASREERRAWVRARSPYRRKLMDLASRGEEMELAAELPQVFRAASLADPANPDLFQRAFSATESLSPERAREFLTETAATRVVPDDETEGRWSGASIANVACWSASTPISVCLAPRSWPIAAPKRPSVSSMN